ncbi:MAG: hypothetical protein MGG37_11275 [Trichodesmium sp. MAG_R01]|nr:hypothetical protein [Trichodesmium sp. MAG_R01]
MWQAEMTVSNIDVKGLSGILLANIESYNSVQPRDKRSLVTNIFHSTQGIPTTTSKSQNPFSF